MRKQIPTAHTNLDPTNIDHIPSSGTHFRSDSMLYVFGSNEAVITTVTNGRSPTMRQLSKTHRVVCDCLSGGIDLGATIQIRYIDTKHHLADILTKGN